ncbi:GIN domain-containing protein [Parvularcula sp. IMCC14364]|uniref:GIN domain-containing protein n=1 Tax=Parvularcula sp. IMCC14364 TaxID=3067902 RepID=UPI00274237DD|nr:DUF2807 domain-containing protein [Parvularcula sp. IMCC14364]
MVFARIAGGLVGLILMMAMTAVVAKDNLPFRQGSPIQLSPFSTLVLRGGGEVTVRPSTAWSATVVQGGDLVAMYTDDGNLLIECKRPCRGNARRIIEVRVPYATDLKIENGGVINVSAGFQAQQKLTAAVTAGGTINAFDLQAADIEATIRGGGTINVTATTTLTANVLGNGIVTYGGAPRVRQDITGRGQVLPR